MNKTNKHYVVDGDNKILVFENGKPTHWLSQEAVCDLLNKQVKEISILDRMIDQLIDEYDLYWWDQEAAENKMTLKEYVRKYVEKDTNTEEKEYKIKGDNE